MGFLRVSRFNFYFNNAIFVVVFSVILVIFYLKYYKYYTKNDIFHVYTRCSRF